MQLKSVLKQAAGRRGRLLIRRLRTRRFPVTPTYRAYLKGMKAIEIGGPSDLFGYAGSLPIYSSLSSIDNTNYSDRTLWRSEAVTFNRTLICEGTELPVEDATYDCVIASHCLEHIANPIKALLEWRRVLRKDGLLLLILPHRDFTFDWRRPVTTIEHLREDFRRQTPEDDLTHLHEVLALHDLSRDLAAGTHEQFKARCLKNSEFRAIHHHVFLPEIVSQLVAEAGFTLIRQDTPEAHIITLCRKP
jgi:SAM-dependent methyltransferase